MDRRQWMATAASAVGTAGASSMSRAAEGQPRTFCAFIKFVQELSYEALAAKIASMGYQGIEATVRKGGHVLPERVEQDLPRLVRALKQEGLEITVMASDINDPSDPVSRRVLETAAKLGVQRYRMKYFRYSLDKPVVGELSGFRQQAERLATANRKLGLSAVYQNHAGARYVGATVWDLLRLLQDVNPREVGVAFDIRHATATGGESWEVLWNVIQPHLQMVYVKDFQWTRRAGAASGDATQTLQRQSMENVALGQGQVHPKFFRLLDRVPVPTSVHVEYLHGAGLEANLKALDVDLATLKKLMAPA